jgi:CheY-like chemotaxis protein
MSGFEVLDQLARQPKLKDLPVVVFTGRELSAEEDSSLHTWRAASSSKTWNPPSVCSTKPRSSCIASSPIFRTDKQRMLDRLHRSDDALRPQGARRRR